MAMPKIYTTLLLLLILAQGFAQEIPKSDSLQNPEIENLLMFSISYTSNNMKTKNYEYDRIPALLTDIYFYHETGLTASLNYTNYHRANKNTYETEIQLGYQKNLLPNLVLNSYYARRNFVGDTTYEGLAQKNTLALNATYTWKFLDLQVSNSYLNGKSNNYFLDLDLSASLDFDQVFSENDFLLFNPTLSATFGTDYWVFQNLSPTYEHIVTNYLSRNNFNSHRFEYQSISVFFPLVYNINNVGFMFNFYYSWPSAKLSKLNWENQSGVLFSIFYTPNI